MLKLFSQPYGLGRRAWACMLGSFLLFSFIYDARSANLIPVSCWFKAPLSIEAACYQLPVQENRKQPGKILNLPVVRLHFKSANMPYKKDPVIYIPGGPGDGGWLDQARIGFWWDFIGDNKWAQERDIILYDPRGTGRTEPRMDCPELEAVAPELLGLGRDYKKAVQLSDQATLDCYQRLIKEGFDPNQYSSATNAQDLHELFIALNRPKWNIYGLSYGTRFALTYLRDYPDDIRSLILDSVLSPDVNFLEDTAWFVNRAMETLAQGCANSKTCRQYGDLKEMYVKIIDQLNQKPMTFTVAHPHEDKDVQVVFTGDMFIEFIFINLYNRTDIEELPKKIKAIADGKSNFAKEAAEDIVRTAIQREDFGEAMSNSIDCIEEAPFNDPVKAKENFKYYPLLASLSDIIDTGADCEAWAVVKGDILEAHPVKSDVPTLLLTGHYDPVTPPPYARKAAAGLGHSFLFEFPNVGHDVLSNEPCANKIAENFLNTPWVNPRDPCLAKLDNADFK